MATLASDWLTEIYSKVGTNVTDRVLAKWCYFYVDQKSNMATLAFVAR